MKPNTSILTLGLTHPGSTPHYLLAALLLLARADLQADTLRENTASNATSKLFLAQDRQLQVVKIESQSLEHKMQLIVHLRQNAADNTRLAASKPQADGFIAQAELNIRDGQNRSYKGRIKLKNPQESLLAKQLEYELYIPCPTPATALTVSAQIPYRMSDKCKKIAEKTLKESEEPGELNFEGEKYTAEFLPKEPNAVTLKLSAQGQAEHNEFAFYDEKNRLLEPLSKQTTSATSGTKLQFSYTFASLPQKFTIAATSWSNFSAQRLACEVELSLQGVSIKQLQP